MQTVRHPFATAALVLGGLLPTLVTASTPILGTLSPTASLSLLGDVRFDSDGTDAIVASWRPTRGPIDLPAGDATFTTVTWEARSDLPRSPSVVRGPVIDASAVAFPSARLIVEETGDAARFVLSSREGTPARARLADDVTCRLDADRDAPIPLLEDARIPFAVEASPGTQADRVFARCDADRLDVTGGFDLTMIGVRARLETQGDGRAPASVVAIDTGLTSAAGPTSVRHTLSQVRIGFERARASMDVAGEVDVRAGVAYFRGSLDAPPLGPHGEADGGEGAPATMSGEYRFTPGAQGALVVDGLTWTRANEAVVGAGVLVATLGLVRALLPPLAFLFTRLSQDRALDQPRRRAIVDAVRANPGASVQELARLLGLGRRVVDYHARVLERQRLLIRRRFPKTVALFAPTITDAAAQRRLHALRDGSLHAVFETLERSPGLSQDVLSRRTGLGQPRISKILARLSSLDLVETIPGGTRRRYRTASRGRL